MGIEQIRMNQTKALCSAYSIGESLDGSRVLPCNHVHLLKVWHDLEQSRDVWAISERTDNFASYRSTTAPIDCAHVRQRKSRSANNSFNFLAAAVVAGVILAAFAAGAGNNKLLEVLGCSGLVVVLRRIVMVVVHGIHSEDGVVGAKGRVGSGGPAPSDVNASVITGKGAADRDGFEVGREATRGNGPGHAREEGAVVGVPRNRCDPDVVNGVEGRGGDACARVNGDMRVGHGLVHADEIAASSFVLELKAGVVEGNMDPLPGPGACDLIAIWRTNT